MLDCKRSAMDLGIRVGVSLLGFMSCIAGLAANTHRPKIYKPQPDACYAQLQPSWPDKPRKPVIPGEDQPVCRAVLAEFNKSCGRADKQTLGFVYPSTKEIQEPDWMSLLPEENLDLVREAYVASASTQSTKADLWRQVEPRVRLWIREGRLSLQMTEIRLHEGGRMYSAYRVNKVRADDIELDKTLILPVIFLAEHAQRIQSANGPGFVAYGNLWAFNDLWFVVGRGPDVYYGPADFRPAIAVAFLNDDLRLSQITYCTIQHINIHRRK